MNAAEWERLKKNWEELCHVFPDDVIVPLFTKGIIKLNEKEDINAERTSFKKMEKLLHILCRKDGTDPYKNLLRVLQTNYSFLVEKIKNTTAKGDPTLMAASDQDANKEIVCHILRENFTQEAGASVPLLEIRDILKEKKAFRDGNEWSNDKLRLILKEEFINIEIKKQVKIVRGKKTKFETNSMVSNLKKDVGSSVFTGNIQEGTILQTDCFETKGFDKETITTTLADPLKERARNFDQDVTPTMKYKFGHCFTDILPNTRGRRTSVMKNFHLVEYHDTDEALELLGSELVPFASACMNERRNGTIYFGVSPAKDSSYSPGQIVGVNVEKEHIHVVVNTYINACFLEAQRAIVRKVVREPKFIPIIKTEPTLSTELTIIEIDILPSQCLMAKEIIKTKLNLLSHQNSNTKKLGVFRFAENGVPKLLTEVEFDTLERELPSIICQRDAEEIKLPNKPKPNLRFKLKNLLFGGLDSFVDDVYPCLITSEIDSHMNQEYLMKNMSFIKNLEPEVVFDFDPTGYSTGIYKMLDTLQEESFRVFTTDNFHDDKKRKEKENYDEIVNSISRKTDLHWVFCNGYENLEAMNRIEWNKSRRMQFREALSLYTDKFKNERLLIIICLFSKNYETLLLACEEILICFPNNWILLAESEEIANSWQERMRSADKANESDLNNRCVIGMTWEQISNLIDSDKNSDKGYKFLLPCSNGAQEIVPKKRLNEWSDVDILTAGDLDVGKGEEISKKMNVVQQTFYRGEEVQWLNFWFGEQVLEREIHESLKEAVNQALDCNTEEDKVTYVELFHHPGAGGTTSAKNILWHFRTKYRCCHVKRITESTCNQLDEIWQFKDPNPKPLLVFIDNQDEEEFYKLKGKLEEKGRINWRNWEESFDVFCTILECKRRVSLPHSLKSYQIHLRQKLFPKEQSWFDRKNESLNKLYGKHQQVNLKSLLAFNIMREHFNPKYVENVVREFFTDVKEELEIELLKIVSFLNAYDPDFQPVKVSWLDNSLKTSKNMSVCQKEFFTRDVKWEAKLSEAVKFFLNLSNDRKTKKKSIQSVRIMSKKVADEILKCIKGRTKVNESDIMLQMCRPNMYRQAGKDAWKFRSLINAVAKKREFNENGQKKNFSCFVMYVQENEGVEVVLKVLETLFAENNDAFTAQVISRVYMENKNWLKASSFAKKAVQLKPENSFLWDTVGRVAKTNISDIVLQNKQNGVEGYQDQNILDIIDLAYKGIDAFKKQQQVSERELSTDEGNNVAGYFGELSTILLILEALKCHGAFANRKSLQKYLTDAKYNPKEFQFLQQHAIFIKSLKWRSNEVLRRLNEESLQMKSRNNQGDSGTVHNNINTKSLIALKAQVDAYFEEDGAIPDSLSESEVCLYRLDKAQLLGADSLNHLLYLRKNKEFKKIQQCYIDLSKNVKSTYCTFDDLRAMLDVVTVILVDNSRPPGLLFEHVVAWSKKLYYMEQPKDTIHSYMEPFLYFVLYNFPTEERIEYVCPLLDLKKAIEKWYDTFKKNHPNHGLEFVSLKRRVTTLFFLGNGKPLEDIVIQESLEGMDKANEMYDSNDKTKKVPFKEKWQNPDLRHRLRLMEGILSDDGKKVNICIKTKEGNRFELPISTSHQVSQILMWNKKVYFYIGFSFKGPRAYGMSLEKLGEKKDQWRY